MLKRTSCKTSIRKCRLQTANIGYRSCAHQPPTPGAEPGQIDEAFAAYRRVEALGEQKGDKELLAVAYGNLGILYQTRGALEQAEAMFQKSLALFEEMRIKDKAEQVSSLLKSLRE